VRVLLIVLVVMGLAFMGVVIFGMAHDRERPREAQGCGGPPPMDGGEVDKDALEKWCPPDLASKMADLMAPFARKLKLDQPFVAADVLFPVRRDAPPVKNPKQIRTARVEWVSGAGMVVTHVCVPGKNRRCPEEQVCVCPQGTHDEDAFARCGKGWVNQRAVGDDRIRCSERDAHPSLVIYSEGGRIEFQGLGGRSLVEVK
jgi:hypothetical protein